MRNINKKIVLIGKPGAGKTSFLFQLTDKKFLPDDKRRATVGADVSFLTQEPFYFRIWDTAGEQDIKKETHIYCYNADLMVFFIDLTCIDESIQYFQNITEEIPKDAEYLVVFTKKDLVKQSEMHSTQQLQQYARTAFKAAGISSINGHLITSAKATFGIQDVLQCWVDLLTPIIVPMLVLPSPKEEKKSFLGLSFNNSQNSESEDEPEALVSTFTF